MELSNTNMQAVTIALSEVSDFSNITFGIQFSCLNVSVPLVPFEVHWAILPSLQICSRRWISFRACVVSVRSTWVSWSTLGALHCLGACV